jgi:hypothetical protein
MDKGNQVFWFSYQQKNERLERGATGVSCAGLRLMVAPGASAIFLRSQFLEMPCDLLRQGF